MLGNQDRNLAPGVDARDHDAGHRIQNEPIPDDFPPRSQELRNHERRRFSPSCSPPDDCGLECVVGKRSSSISSSQEDDSIFGGGSDVEREPSIDHFMSFLNQQQSLLNTRTTPSTSTTPPLDDIPGWYPNQAINSVESAQLSTTTTTPSTTTTTPPTTTTTSSTTITAAAATAASAEAMRKVITRGTPYDVTGDCLQGIELEKEMVEANARSDFYNASNVFQSHLIDPPLSPFHNHFPISLSMDLHPLDIPVFSPIDTNPLEPIVINQSSNSSLLTQLESQPKSSRGDQNQDDTMPVDIPVRRKNPDDDEDIPFNEETDGTIVDQVSGERPISPTGDIDDPVDQDLSNQLNPETATTLSETSRGLPIQIDLSFLDDAESDPEDETYEPKLDDSRIMTNREGYSDDEDEDEDDSSDQEMEGSDLSDNSDVGGSRSTTGRINHLGEKFREGVRLEERELRIAYAGLKDYLTENQLKNASKVRGLRSRLKVLKRSCKTKSRAIKLLKSRLKNKQDKILELGINYRTSLEEMKRSLEGLKDHRLYVELCRSNRSIVALEYQKLLILEELKILTSIHHDFDQENKSLRDRLVRLESENQILKRQLISTSPSFQSQPAISSFSFPSTSYTRHLPP